MPTLSLVPAPPLARSLECNDIKAEGTSVLAAVLKETQITNLKCAATPEVFAFVSAPVDTFANTSYYTSSLSLHLQPCTFLLASISEHISCLGPFSLLPACCIPSAFSST